MVPYHKSDGRDRAPQCFQSTSSTLYLRRRNSKCLAAGAGSSSNMLSRPRSKVLDLIQIHPAFRPWRAFDVDRHLDVMKMYGHFVKTQLCTVVHSVFEE